MTTDIDIIKTARHVAAVLGLAGMCTPALVEVLNDNHRGYPTRASGSDAGGGSPELLDDEPLGYQSSTERAAINPDEAKRIKARFARIISDIERYTLELQNIIGFHLNGHTVDPSEAKDEDEERDKLFCVNHLRHRMFAPRDERHKLCHFCRKFQGAEEALPDRDLLDTKERRGKLTDRDLLLFKQREQVRAEEATNDARAARKGRRKGQAAA